MDTEEASQLLQLPCDLLRMIWRHLMFHRREQAALRSTCKGMVHATTPFISSLCIKVLRLNPAEGEEALIKQALDTFKAFPRAAKLVKLQWSFFEASGPMHTFRTHHVVLPALLPSFVLHATDRLAMLEVVEIMGHSVVTSGDLSSLANACPRLQEVILQEVRVCGPVFASLSLLTALTTLTLSCIRALGPAPRVCSSLSQLSRLTKLMIASYDDSSPADRSGLFSLIDFVPCITPLTSLCRLTLYLPDGNPAGDVLQPLTSLMHLTSFACTLNAVLGTDLLLPTRLATLSLGDATLSAAAIRTVASLPHLLDLRVGTLDPGDVDLSDLACSWRKLTLSSCPSPHRLIHSPLHSLSELCLDHRIDWTLDPTEDAQLTAITLSRAARVLARLMPAVLFVCLDWAAPCVPPRPHVLSGLAPLTAVRRLNLTLGRHWHVDAAVVQQLEQHLPTLQRLTINPAGPGFASFAAAIGGGMASLRYLTVLEPDGGEAQAVESALLAMGGMRAGKGGSLAVLYLGGSVDEARRAVWNAVLSAFGEGVKFGG